MSQARTQHLDKVHADASARAPRPRTFYVDMAKLEKSSAVYVNRDTTSKRSSGRVSSVDAEVKGLRRNVQDTARAVLTWLSCVTQHDHEVSLDIILDRCLRPSPDATELNYAALAEQINDTLGLNLSAKRVQTAVRHLRDAGQQAEQMPKATTPTLSLAQRFDALRDRLEANHEALLREQNTQADAQLRRSVAHDVLCVLRSAAGRLIENSFGEGIPDRVDLDGTQDRLTAFVHRIVCKGQGGTDNNTLRRDLAKLLNALDHYDASADADMRLVVSGAAVVCGLAGPGSLPGVMARLNVMMVGRPILENPFFVAQMLHLADEAGKLIDDTPTCTYLSWVRHQPSDRQTPSANRVRSYCLNNAATHILQRLVTCELTGGQWFKTAQHCFDTMKKHDRGFQLLRTTEAIMLATVAELTGCDDAIRDLFERLGEADSLALLIDLRRFDNSDDLNRLVRSHAVSVHAGLMGQLLVLD